MAKRKRNEKGYLRKTFTYEGKRYTVYGKNNEELFEKETKKKAELTNQSVDLYNPTLDDYYETFTNIRRNQLRESTLRAQKYQYKYISDIEIVKEKRFGSLRIKDITRRDIEIARQKMLDDGKTPENINICFAHLNHVLNNACIDETIDKNPCKSLKKLKRTSEVATKTIHRALSIDETVRFFKMAKERNSYYYNFFEMMIKTGMRIGEVSALFPADIDKKNGFIHVRRTVTRDEIGNYYISDDPKTVSGVRDIPLTDNVLQIVKKQEELNRMIFGLKWSGSLFQTYDGNLLREYTINREIKRICKAAEIDYFSSHAFRDTFATRFIEQRPQDYKDLSEILGHKDISITLNLYTHVMTEHKVNAMNDIMIKIS